jgi:hypothetical protein
MLTILLTEKKLVNEICKSLKVYCPNQNSNDALPKATHSWNRFSSVTNHETTKYGGKYRLSCYNTPFHLLPSLSSDTKLYNQSHKTYKLAKKYWKTVTMNSKVESNFQPLIKAFLTIKDNKESSISKGLKPFHCTFLKGNTIKWYLEGLWNCL